MALSSRTVTRRGCTVVISNGWNFLSRSNDVLRLYSSLLLVEVILICSHKMLIHPNGKRLGHANRLLQFAPLRS